MKQLRRLVFPLTLSIAIELLLRLIDDILRFNKLLEPASESEGDLARFVGIILLSSAVGLIAESARLIAIGHGTGRMTVGMGWGRRLELLQVETLRSLAAIIIRIPLLLVPALTEWMRLLPVPFVVLCDKSYAEGRTDALARAREFTRRYKGTVIGASALLLVPTLYEWALELASNFLAQDSVPLWADPAQHIGSCAALGILKLVVDAVLIWLYQRRFAQMSA